MTTKHTPGPWHVVAFLDEHDRRGRNVLVSEDTPGAKFRVHAAHFTPAYGIPVREDAHLIAAAPEMAQQLRHTGSFLVALERIFPLSTPHDVKANLAAEIAAIDAALAKAEGRET